ncbi:Peptidase M23 [Modestobacter italicus]|uniref:Peptidase M23 n=1 Tax=Modestobacter italicus (strain DSM 44449 / CECT 9708 / BC 501) TaxID=2732864 RepID=I4EVG3_MODI5|nr:M23 family metallopeptidase [Modestobacter marinus]CCH87376.1 Peptidase M23 [Modestobacter marinus]
MTLHLTLASAPASAAPGDNGAGPAAAQSTVDAAGAEVARVEGLLAAAELELQRLTVTAEAAGEASRVAAEELTAAQTAAAGTAAELATAQAATVATRDDVAELGRESYMGADALGGAVTLLGARSPEDLLERAAMLHLVGDDQAQRLEALRNAEAQVQRADQAARDALAARDVAAQAADRAAVDAQAQLAQAQVAYDSTETEKVALEAQLRAAQVQLLTVRGNADADAMVQKRQQAVAAASAAGTESLAAGRVTSCFGSRWGTNHNGVDIAAPIGTPIYAPDAGVVLQAGPANGFGLAVYIQHADGTISLYGHINQAFVSAGQRVAAGEQIAEVGNRGQSTGPHVHVEVHTGGLYVNRTDPAPWLAARGISLGGACSG